MKNENHSVSFIIDNLYRIHTSKTKDGMEALRRLSPGKTRCTNRGGVDSGDGELFALFLAHSDSKLQDLDPESGGIHRRRDNGLEKREKMILKRNVRCERVFFRINTISSKSLWLRMNG